MTTRLFFAPIYAFVVLTFAMFIHWQVTNAQVTCPLNVPGETPHCPAGFRCCLGNSPGVGICHPVRDTCAL
ncbi:hypothetical protein CPB84DRAFT_1795556 [Gymnopilus junonius]|uniref:Uncharacterized protein n=1 Tax=Gymnopilus junonius TaxID=109634 RepID=A0A9P5THI9_GYMJU|nr:hypothetical protein CPB84DRAFT_1795556 [Gymnopilus junonius]